MFFRDSSLQYFKQQVTRAWVTVRRASWSISGHNWCTKYCCTKAVLTTGAICLVRRNSELRGPPNYELLLKRETKFSSGWKMVFLWDNLADKPKVILLWKDSIWVCFSPDKHIRVSIFILLMHPRTEMSN